MKKGVFFTVARGPVPRDRWDARTMARDRVSHRPTVIETRRSLLPGCIAPTSVVRDRPIPNGSGSGDPDLQGRGMRSARQTHGEGQALALRKRGAFCEEDGPLPERGGLSPANVYRTYSAPRCSAIQVFSGTSASVGCHQPLISTPSPSNCRRIASHLARISGGMRL